VQWYQLTVHQGNYIVGYLPVYSIVDPLSVTKESRLKPINQKRHNAIRGHPFMTSTRRGSQAQVDACGRGRGVKPRVDVHTEN